MRKCPNFKLRSRKFQDWAWLLLGWIISVGYLEAIFAARGKNVVGGKRANEWDGPSPPIDISLVGDCSLFPANLHLRRHYRLTSLALFSFLSSPSPFFLSFWLSAAARGGNVRGCCCCVLALLLVSAPLVATSSDEGDALSLFPSLSLFLFPISLFFLISLF